MRISILIFIVSLPQIMTLKHSLKPQSVYSTMHSSHCIAASCLC